MASHLDVTLPKAIDWKYVYDRLGRLAMVKSAKVPDEVPLPEPLPAASTYAYDASDNRTVPRDRFAVATMVGSGASTSGSSAPTISYLIGHQSFGAEINGNFQFFLPDALGTVRDIVDDTGAVIQSYEFNEHGIPMPGSGAGTGTFSPKTYQGGLAVNDDRNDSGLYLMGHRHYAAELGRFISRDPIGFRGGLNLFNGHSTSPLRFVDPSGLVPGGPYRHDWGNSTHWNNDPADANLRVPPPPPPAPVPPGPVRPPSPPQPTTSEWGGWHGPPVPKDLGHKWQGPTWCPSSPPGVSVDANIDFAAAKRSRGEGGYGWFYRQVRNSGPMDYKQTGPYEAFGNFNYGAVGHALGIPDEVLLRGAGLAQAKAGTSKPEWGHPNAGPPYGDDPADQAWIQAGIDYSRARCKD